MPDLEEVEKKSSLDKNQKIAVAVLVFFGLFIISIWAVQFKKSLTDPFVYKGVDNTKEDATLSQQALDSSDEALKTKDTDGDGLSDWDELNIYKTSPYLDDSDSDGIKDGEEVNKGTDPNCPIGKDCSVTTPATASSTTPVLNNNIGSAVASPNLDVSGQSNADLQKMLQGGLDAVSLRKILIDSGMDQNALSKISDTELMSKYQELLKNSTNTVK